MTAVQNFRIILLRSEKELRSFVRLNTEHENKPNECIELVAKKQKK